MAVGNDYNDLDLLEWADHAYVVGNAPAELRARYTAVASNEEGGFSAAVKLALTAR
jgi:hydroxymethylpyrimidine pyrophosphatase-like HAD family hydrolase